MLERLRMACKGFKRYPPYLHINIDLGFLEVATNLMYRKVECCHTEYISLYVKFFKWHGSFALYDTDKQQLRR